MSVASILIVGISAAYSALSRASARVATASADLTAARAPGCRPGDAAPPNSRTRWRCQLPEQCAYDPISAACRAETGPSQ